MALIKKSPYFYLFIIISCAPVASLLVLTDTGLTSNYAIALEPEPVLNISEFSAVSTTMTAETNQTVQGEIILPYERNITAEFPFESHYIKGSDTKEIHMKKRMGYSYF
jgi:hypothetical protein